MTVSSQKVISTKSLIYRILSLNDYFVSRLFIICADTPKRNRLYLCRVASALGPSGTTVVYSTWGRCVLQWVQLAAFHSVTRQANSKTSRQRVWRCLSVPSHSIPELICTALGFSRRPNSGVPIDADEHYFSSPLVLYFIWMLNLMILFPARSQADRELGPWYHRKRQMMSCLWSWQRKAISG
jgi:hypothetical protein